MAWPPPSMLTWGLSDLRVFEEVLWRPPVPAAPSILFAGGREPPRGCVLRERAPLDHSCLQALGSPAVWTAQTLARRKPGLGRHPDVGSQGQGAHEGRGQRASRVSDWAQPLGTHHQKQIPRDRSVAPRAAGWGTPVGVHLPVLPSRGRRSLLLCLQASPASFWKLSP